MYSFNANLLIPLSTNKTALTVRPFLKWPGGKYRLREIIANYLPNKKVLVEPFAGACAITLNTNYSKYVVNDINPDLIALYLTLQQEGLEFVTQARKLFHPRYNNPKSYYRLRKRFNSSLDVVEKSKLFLYLNKHGYNGLCRYNLQRGYNVPFGSYKKPYFPEKELLIFIEKSQQIKFSCKDFSILLSNPPKNSVIYCDPPYIPLQQSSNFTKYAGNQFGLEQQIKLSEAAKAAATKGHTVIISNHDTPLARELYQGAKIKSFLVNRYISCKASQRKPVKELLAIFE